MFGEKCIPIEWKCMSCGCTDKDHIVETEEIEILMRRISEKHKEISPNCGRSVEEIKYRYAL